MVAASHKTMPQIKALQVFRGLAALVVVMYHASISTTMFVDSVPPYADSVLGKGYLGVDFFFVLSGFIIMYAHAADQRSFGSVKRYAIKRLVRIFPAYLPVCIGMLAVHVLVPAYSAAGAKQFSVLSSLLLVPADRPPILTVAWSLVHEMLFYGVFLLFFLSRRVFAVALLLWAGAILTANLNQAPDNWLRYPLSILNIEFMLGVSAAWLVTSRFSRCRPEWLVLGGIGIAILGLLAMNTYSLSAFRIDFAFGLAIMIVGFAKWEVAASPAWPALLILMGNASYSIYLVHNPVLSITQRASRYVGSNWVGGIGIGVSASLVAGYVYHVLIERRAVLLFGGWLKRSKGESVVKAREIAQGVSDAKPHV